MKGVFLAYGDPRPSGEIRVRVFGLTPKGNPTKKQITEIAIRDYWKNDIAGKLAGGIDKATGLP